MKSLRYVTSVLLVLAALVLGLSAVANAASSLTPGPVSTDNGYPTWYRDSSGLRLELCLEGPNCLTPPPDPTQPVQFPFNWSDEEFYYRADAALTTPAGARIRLVLANEAAFFGTAVIPGDQIVFTRIRVFATGLQPDTTYTFTHPYGTESLTTDELGTIRFTDDQGCLQPPCDMSQPITSRFGPFLRGTLPAPAGFLADPAVPQAVTGSPTGNNLFRAEGPDIGTLTTDQFTISGKIAGPTVTASPAPGAQSGPFSLTLTADDQADALPVRIFYTIDGSDPTTASTEYTGPISISQSTLVKWMGVNAAGGFSRIYTGQYFVGATPTASPAGGFYNKDQSVTLSSVPDSTIHFTTDGSVPTLASPVYTGPITISTPTTLKFFSDFGNGTLSGVVTEIYNFDNIVPTVLVDPPGGYYSANQQVRLVISEAGDVFYTLDGSTPTTASTRYTGPITISGSTAVTTPTTTTLKLMGVDRAGNQSEIDTQIYNISIGQEGMGPINQANGFPSYYQDPTGRRLELCDDAVTTTLCGLLPTDLPNPNAPEVFPTNYPEEGFWWRGVAVMLAGNSGRATLVLATEAAFGTAPAAGDQIVFNRFRVFAHGLVPGATYKVTHPYGVNTYVADELGDIRVTEDIGCLTPPCNFTTLGWPGGHVGPWLVWDPATAPAPPPGFIGDVNINHSVVGSPAGTNFFRLEGPNAGGPSIDVAQTDQFSITGKLPGPKVSASPKGADCPATKPCVSPLQVSLTATDTPEDGAVTIYYTTDGTDPIAANDVPGTPASPVYSGPLTLTTSTTLKFLAVNAIGGRSTVQTEVYTVDAPAPTVSATPAGGTYSTAQTVTLAANQPNSTIYYTIDGSTPNPTTNVVTGPGSITYSAPITIDTNTTLKFIAVNAAGARSAVVTEIYTIVRGQAAVGPVDETNGFPAWYQDAAGTRLELCLDQTTGLCLATPPNTGQPVVFPTNFPDESFYWNGTAIMPGGKLILAGEAGFLGGPPLAGDQITFTRIRATLDGLVPGGKYRVTHPYGTDIVVADATGGARITEQVGCAATPCDFNAALGGRLNSFLRWDNTAPAPPAGYIGDPNVTHTVTGSPFNTNVFRVEQIDDLGNVIKLVSETNQFAIQGKIAGPKVTASPRGGAFAQPVSVTLTSSEPATIHYTTDGSTPTAASPVYSAPISIATNTTLKFFGVNAAKGTSAVVTETYLVDATPPTVTIDAKPTDPTSDPVAQFSFSSNEPGSTFECSNTLSTATTDAFAACTSPKSFGPLDNGTYTFKVRATDPAHNVSAPVTYTYTVGAVAVATPSVPDLDATSDTGDSTTDNLTADNTPTFTGTAPAGLAVEIVVDGALKGSAAAAADGTYSVTTSVLADGVHAVTARTRDAGGNVSNPSAPLSVTINTAPPKVTAPAQHFVLPSALTAAPNPANTTIPVKLDWTVTPAANGVSRVEVMQSVNNGNFTPVTLPAGPVDTVTVDLKPGTVVPQALINYRFQVRACDSSNVCSAFVQGPRFTLVGVDDGVNKGVPAAGNAAVIYGGKWAVGPVTGAYGGAVHSATEAKSTATLNKTTFFVNGNASWVSTMGPDRGLATVSVDGGAPVQVDLYSPNAQPAKVVWTQDLPAGTHTIIVSALGTKNPASTGTRVDLDAFVINI